ncbi:DM13 domain-containing protein [Krasilnikoviella flava]|uniref:Electron transfer DM13 n=1 Tax=Krasilnikoviella flava TaxID=526729 RepID=A0A1T5IEZ7_9MICO|nr:DM13 domain-containing protein [Krasilnikoviella flava]SKC37660.1 Electron transfer DM13 [Krasilnikoviella flava]
MRAKALATTGLVALALTLSACGADDGSGSGSGDMAPTATESMSSDDMGSDDMESDDMASAEPMAQHGTFAGLNDKSVEGTVTVEGDTVTLSGFSSDEGRDLHLYLAKGTDEAAVSAGTELGTVAFDEESQTFTLDDMDVDGYTDVVVHCDKAEAVFGAATLM